MAYFKMAMVGAVAVTLAGCTVQTTLSGTNQTLNAEAQAIYQDVVQGNDEAVVARLAPDADAASIKAQLPLYRTLAGTEAPPAPVVVESANSGGTAGKSYSVSQSYTYSDRVVTTVTGFGLVDQDWKLRNLEVTSRMLPQAPAA